LVCGALENVCLIEKYGIITTILLLHEKKKQNDMMDVGEIVADEISYTCECFRFFGTIDGSFLKNSSNAFLSYSVFNVVVATCRGLIWLFFLYLL